MPRINSVKQRQLVVTAPDQSRERVIARRSFKSTGTGAGAIFAMAAQPDGKILVGGLFTTFNGTSRNRLVRLNADGTVDDDFHTNLGTAFSGAILSIAVQSDGKILVGGQYTSFNGNTRNRLVRLNTDGTEDTAFYANLGTAFNIDVIAIVLQSDGKILVGGAFSSLNGVSRRYLARLNTDGTEDTAFHTNLGFGFNGTVWNIALQSDGKILVGGDLTTLDENIYNRLVRLNTDGTVDTAFSTNLTITAFNSTVYAIAVQSDGKILVGGDFTLFKGVTLRYLVRLNTDGTEDTAFYANLGNGFNSTVRALGLQSDGKILVAGSFTSFNDSNTRNRLLRLNSDGTEDTVFYENIGLMGFDAVIYAVVPTSTGILIGGDFDTLDGTSRLRIVKLNDQGIVLTSTVPVSSLTLNLPSDAINDIYLDKGFNNDIAAIAAQSDGGILVGGQFTSYDETARIRLLRLLSDGSVDTGFYANLGTSFNNRVRAIAEQSDGKILVGGDFTSLGGNTRNRLVRLNSDGTEDTAFYTNLGTGFNQLIYAIVVQSDGKILVGGGFTTYDGAIRNRLIRLNSDGTGQTVFYANLGSGFNSSVLAIVEQSDGKILVGGSFTALAGTTRNRLVRLNSDGTVDTDFYTNLGTAFNNQVDTVAVQSDGKILVGGSFTSLNGNTRRRLVRLNSDGTEDTAFYNELNAGFSSTINRVAVQSDGKILVAGVFSSFNGPTRNRLLRLNANGTEDTAFYSNLGTGFNNSVNIVVVQSDGRISVSGVFTIFNGRPLRGLVRLASSGALPVFTVDEGNSARFTVSTVNIRNGTELRWRIIDKPEDFDTVSGTFTVENNRGTFTVTPSADLITEGSETFRVEISKPSGTILATSSSVTINDTSTSTLSISADRADVNEGSTVNFTVTVVSENLPDGTTLYWTVDSPLDFAQSSGSFVINSSSGSFSVTPLADILTEGTETFTASVRAGSINGLAIVTSDPVTINDTSLSPTYTIVPSAGNINEGSALSITVNTQRVGNGTTLYWTATNSVDFATSSGSFVINSNTGSFSVTPTADFSLDEGSETFQLEIRTGSISGDIVETSDPITINDTSVGSSPVNTAAPTISGTVAVGSTLSCSTGSWTGQPTPTFTYQWQNNSADIVGATSSSYTLTSNDYQDLIRCQVTATNTIGTATANSAATAGVAAQLPSNTSSPTISGDAVVSQTLTVSNGTWSGFPEPTFSYQWLRNGSNISGATNSTYTLTTDDTGSTLLDRYTISCRVTATNAAGDGSATTSSTSTVMPFLGQQVAGGHFVGLISQLGNGSPSHYLIAAYKTDEQTLEMRTFYGGETYTGPSDIDGALNTQYFFELHVPGVREYPAAVYATNYSSGGYTDWYIPARYELEIAYYNLKPNSGFNDTDEGTNIYAVPPRGSNYTTTVPGRTSNTDFREGGAFAFSTFRYWTSTSNTGTTGIRSIRFSDGESTVDDGIGQNVVRPFRRVSI